MFCSVIDPHGSNKKFLEDMSDLALRANCKLIICPLTENQGDRWIQVGSGADPGREWGWPGRPEPPTLPPPPRGRILFWKTILRSLWSLPLSSQDEMEFGYVEAPHKSFPVVFDSPRDRGLKDFAKKILVCSKGRNGEPLGGSSYRTLSSVLPDPGSLGDQRTQAVGSGK